jgi:hypothetical protein
MLTENLRLSSAYRLVTLPTLLLFDRGEVRQRLEGFPAKPKQQYVTFWWFSYVLLCMYRPTHNTTHPPASAERTRAGRAPVSARRGRRGRRPARARSGGGRRGTT